MSPVLVFLFSLLILLTGVTSEPESKPDPLNADEKKALITFITKVKHSRRFSWKESEHACNWKGVTCLSPDNTTVIYLRLPATSLVGEIPSDTIGKLTNLRVLSLRINKLKGTIPSDFSKLTSLTHLILYNNSFSGQLPFIEADLTGFNVSMNQLNSSIPNSLSKFAQSAFSVNVYLCGAPFNNTCNSSYPSPIPVTHKNNDGKAKKRHEEIVGISVGSGLLLLLLLCCVQKKMYDQKRKRAPKPTPVASTAGSSAGKSTEEGRNKLVMFDDGIYRLDLEDLLTASAEVLGEGSGGISYKQVLEGKMTTVVVKRLKDVVVTEEGFRSTMEDLRKLENKNVVPLRGFYCSKDEKWLVYGYMRDGSLSARLHGSMGLVRTKLDWDHRMRIALSAAEGLAYLHTTEKVHGNIKSSNILLRQETNNIIKASVSDYGLNTLFIGSSSLNHQVTGYWAPEVLKAQKVTFESDVYSFGVLLLEILTGKTPKQASSGKEGVNFSKWVKSIVDHREESKAEIFDVELRGYNEAMTQLLGIAKDCVSTEPDQRPSMHDVVMKMENMWLRPSSDDHSKGSDYTPSTEATRDTPSTITP